MGAAQEIGVAEPTAYAAVQKQADIARASSRLDHAIQLKGRQAQVRQVEASANYTGGRLSIERDKANAAAFKQAQSLLAREIGNRLREPHPFDVSDPYDLDLARRAQAAGVSFDPKGFGDTRNPATLEILDPSDPSGTRKTRAVYDRASNTWKPLAVGGQPVETGYATPVDATTGMTAAQSGNLQLGGKRLDETVRRDDETVRRDKATEAQGAQRIGLSRAQLQLGYARLAQGEVRLAQSADAKTRGRFGKLSTLIERRNKLEADAQKWRSYKDPDSGEVQPWAEKRARVLETQVDSLEDDMHTNFGDLLQQAAESDDGMITGPEKARENRHQMAFPKPPARGATSSPAAGEDPMVRSYANDHFGGDYNAAQRAIAAQRARKGKQ